MHIRRCIFMLIFLIHWASAATASPKSKAIDLVEEKATVLSFMQAFCAAEFNGGLENWGIRWDAVKFSKKREREEKATDPDFERKAIKPGTSPMFIVASYQIVSASVKNNRATAVVDYYRLARTETVRRLTLHERIIPDCKKHEIVTYHLIMQDNRWWLFDPPLARVSLEAITRYFQNLLAHLGPDWPKRPEISDAQREYYRNHQNDLKILGKLHKICEN